LTSSRFAPVPSGIRLFLGFPYFKYAQDFVSMQGKFSARASKTGEMGIAVERFIDNTMPVLGTL
jgi:hypothetical protein